MPSLDRKAKRHRKMEQRKDPKIPPGNKINLISQDEWDRKVAVVRQKGERFAKEMHSQGKPFKIAHLGPKEFPKDAGFQLHPLTIQHDWKAVTKLEMVKDANNFLAKARQIDIFHPDVVASLRSVLEENPLPMHSIGEFFILYGRFQQEYGLSTSERTKNKMEELMKGGEVHRKEYEEDGQNKTAPLPYFARNFLAHLGTDKNKFLPEELDRAKEMLAAWLHP